MCYHRFGCESLSTPLLVFQALYGTTGASNAILRLVRNGELQLAISVPVFEEYRDVLLRKKTLRQLALSSHDIQSVLEFVALVGVRTPIDYLWRPNLKDETDNIFVELAVASGSEYLVTQNVRDFTVGNELRFDSFRIVTPSDFMTAWRNRSHG